MVEYALLIFAVTAVYAVGTFWVIRDAVTAVLGGKGLVAKAAARHGLTRRGLKRDGES